jgi:putative ABC transport system permease protein
MEAPDMTFLALLAISALLLIPLLISRYLGLKMARESVMSVLQMSGQLLLFGIFLEYLFKLNNPFVTLLWLLVMIAFASFTGIKSTGIRWQKFLLPSFLSMIIACLPALFFFIWLSAGTENLLEPQFAIALLGMLLGNALKGNVVAVGDY